MKQIQLKVIKQVFPVVIGGIASLFSVFVLMAEFKSFVRYELMLGLGGALIGVLIGYIFVRIKYATNVPKIFISYAHEDVGFVEKLYKELQRTPFVILWDKHEIQVGDNIKNRTNELLTDCDYVLFVGSKNSTSSDWVKAEIKKAQDSKKKILPIIIDDSKPPDLIKDIMYADFSDSFDKGMNDLAKALKASRHNKSLQGTAGTEAV